MITAIAIDDEPPALQLLSHYCEKSESVDLKATFTSAEEALKYLKKFPIQLVFLDIQMPVMLGIDVCKRLSNEKVVIFTTAHSEYATQGFDLNIADYLLKPYSLERFNKAIQKAETQINNKLQNIEEESSFIMLRADYSLVKIQLKDILYIESIEDYSKIYFIDNTNPMIFRISLKSLVERLPDNVFMRVHRSYIVNNDKVEKIRSNTIYLKNNQEVPIGRLYKSDVVSFFERFLKEK